MDRLRVLTWNLLRHDGYRPYAWPAMLRREPLVASLPRLDWDVACFQEVSPPGLTLLRRSLPAAAWSYGLPLGRTRAGEGLSIAYDPERFERGRSGRFGFVDDAGRFTRSGGCSWLQLRDRRSGRKLVVANGHFPHARAGRVLGAELVRRRLPPLAPGGEVILGADFNAGPDDPIFAELARDGLNRMPQAPRSLMLFGLPLLPIDAVVTSAGLRCTGVERISGRSGVVFASDHAGMLATLEPTAG